MPKIAPLTGLRAYAAMWVVLVHFYSNLDFGFLNAFLRAGNFGVEVFFVLSGFILTHNYHDWFRSGSLKQDARAFFILRFARIYPVHIVVLSAFPLIFLPLDVPVMAAPPTAKTFLLNVSLLHGWGFIDELSWNQASWSVSVEVFCYLLFPLVIVLTRGTARLPLCLSLALVFYIYWRGFPNDILSHFGWSPPSDRTSFRYGSMCLRFFLIFCAGHLAYMICEGWKPHVLWDVAALIAIAGICITPYLPYSMHVLLIVSSCLLVTSLALSVGPAKAMFANRPITYLGKISYSLYLCHIPALIVTGWAFDKTPGLLELFVTMIVSVALFHLIEEPCRRVIRRWAGPAGLRPASSTI